MERTIIKASWEAMGAMGRSAWFCLQRSRTEGSDGGAGAGAGAAEDGMADNEIISNIRGLLHARHCSACFAHINSVNSQLPYDMGILLFLFYKGENWVMQRLSKLPKIVTVSSGDYLLFLGFLDQKQQQEDWQRTGLLLLPNPTFPSPPPEL